jgi:hypothetical protein
MKNAVFYIKLIIIQRIVGNLYNIQGAQLERGVLEAGSLPAKLHGNNANEWKGSRRFNSEEHGIVQSVA